MINRKLNWLLPLLFLALSGCEAFVVGGIVTGLGTGIAVSEDRRTSGTFVEDEGIEFTSAQLIREKTGKNVHVNVTSFNRNALLTGEVPSELIKKILRSLLRVLRMFAMLPTVL